MKKVIVVGCGGHAKVVTDIIKLSGDDVIGYLDDRNSVEGFNIIGTTKDIGVNEEAYYFIAIGNCEVRKRLMQNYCKWYTAIHPTAAIAKDTQIGVGTCFMANSVLNSGALIGKGVIVNTGATVDHDCIIDDYVHIAPGVHISGTVNIGECTWIGVGSTIINNVSICAYSMIGAGTVVVKSIEQEGTYVGVPARKIE